MNHFFSFARPGLAKLLLLTIVFLVVGRHLVYAADRMVTCSPSGDNFSCSLNDTTSPFVSSELWYPGKSMAKTFEVKNDWDKTMRLSVKAEDPKQTGNLASVMNLVIVDSNGNTRYNDTVASFFNVSGGVDLGKLSGKSSIILTFSITMDVNKADDAFQNTSTMFDMPFTFSEDYGDDRKSSGVSTGGGGVVGIAPLTTVPFVQRVTQFFIPTVAGAATEVVPPSSSPEKVALEEVKGATTCQTCTWWQFLLLQAGLLAFHYMLTRQKGRKIFWIGGIIISIFTYIAFLFFNQSCRTGWQLWLSTSSFWCRYFIIWVILIFTVFSFLLKWKRV